MRGVLATQTFLENSCPLSACTLAAVFLLALPDNQSYLSYLVARAKLDVSKLLGQYRHRPCPACPSLSAKNPKPAQEPDRCGDRGQRRPGPRRSPGGETDCDSVVPQQNSTGYRLIRQRSHLLRRRQRSEEQKQKERQKNRLLEICKILDDDAACLAKVVPCLGFCQFCFLGSARENLCWHDICTQSVATERSLLQWSQLLLL